MGQPFPDINWYSKKADLYEIRHMQKSKASMGALYHEISDFAIFLAFSLIKIFMSLPEEP
jgi:hypothetical protein